MKKKWKDFLGVSDRPRITYVEFCDSAGNKLKKEDILFTDEKFTKREQEIDAWEMENEEERYITLNDKGIIPMFDETGNYPIALETEEGYRAYLKISGKTKEILPIHAGCCPSLNVIFIGAPSAGKTVYFLQLCDSAFHDMLARGTRCCFENDMPADDERRQRYEEARRNLRDNKILPEPNRKGEIIFPYYFYIQSQDGGEIRRALLRLEDIDGQQCTEMEWESQIFNSNIFVIAIGADELLANEKGEEVQFTRVVEKLLPRLRVLRPDGDYEILVMITKCDLLNFENSHLKPTAENTVVVEGKKIRQTVHEHGFDYQTFNKRSQHIQDYLKEECPTFYLSLTYAIPDERLNFCMVASIGETCTDNKFENFSPMFIDEPILAILAKEGLYPIKSQKEKTKEKRAESSFKDFGKVVKNFSRRIMDQMELLDE